MIRATTGHPARAFRGMAVLFALWATYRAPEMERAFDAAVAAGERTAVRLRVATARVSRAGTAARAPHLPQVVIALPSLRTGSFERRPLGSIASAPAAIRINRPSGVIGQRLRVDELSAAPFVGIPIPGDLPTLAPTPGDLATEAYARLAERDRRAAVRLFDAALTAGDDPRAATWARERGRLTRRWSASGYSIVRRDGDGASPVTPVLGGAQSGVAAAWTIDPLARAPLALTARASVAHADRRSLIVAAGVTWRPRPGIVVAAERVVRPYDNRGDWTARVAAGGERRFGPVELSGYAEAGFVSRSTYAAAQARAGVATGRIVPGVGAWTSIANGGDTTIGRVDVGPGIAARAGPFVVSVDYRVRVTGNAAPGSGPVLTLTAAF